LPDIDIILAARAGYGRGGFDGDGFANELKEYPK
jgi:hypothetical protein